MKVNWKLPQVPPSGPRFARVRWSAWTLLVLIVLSSVLLGVYEVEAMNGRRGDEEGGEQDSSTQSNPLLAFNSVLEEQKGEWAREEDRLEMNWRYWKKIGAEEERDRQSKLSSQRCARNGEKKPMRHELKGPSDVKGHKMVSGWPSEDQVGQGAAAPSEEETWRILRDFYINLNGSKWYRSDGWMSQAVPICDWFGVTCLPRNSSKQWKPVIALELSNNNCAGVLPSSLGQLYSLRTLDVSSNTIVGAVPKTLGNLTGIQRLDLSDNEFTGTIPDLLSEMFATLEHLDLGGNQLMGPIPTSFFYLTRLTFLNLSSNVFNQKIPDDIAALSSLHKLYLSHNHFYGSLPNGLASLSELIEMDVSHNNFSGELLPDWTASLTSLQVFVGSHNRFSGSTAALGYMANIRKLFLDHNAFSGEIHPYLYQLSQSIAIDLSHNFLTGWVTESLLSTLLSRTQLIYLSLVGNPGLVSYEARIPSFLGIDSSISTHSSVGCFSCARLYLRTSHSTTLLVDPAFFSYQHCSCIRDSYGIPPDECYDCPPGAYCSGSNFFTFDPGWYPIIEPLSHRHHNHSTTPKKGSRHSHHMELKIESSSSSSVASTMSTLPQASSTLPQAAPSSYASSLASFKSSSRFSSVPTFKKPLGYLSGPVLLYPCPDLSGNFSSCNSRGESVFYYNSSSDYGILNNATLCSTGYDLRLCTFCTCAAASHPACFMSSSPFPNGTILDSNHTPIDCSCYYRSSMKCVKCDRVWKFSSALGLVISIWLIFVFLLAFVFYSRKAPTEATLLRFEWMAKIHHSLTCEDGGLRHSGYLKIFVVYLQTLSILTKDHILIYFKLTLGEVFSFGAICAWPLLSDPFNQHLFYLLLPIALILGILLALALAALASKIALRFVRSELLLQEEDYVNDHLIYGGGGLDHNANGSPSKLGGSGGGGGGGSSSGNGIQGAMGGGSFRNLKSLGLTTSLNDGGSHSSSTMNGKSGEYSLVYQGLSAILFVHWWFLFGIAYRSLSVFNCASDPLSSFLETQPWLGCHSPEYQGLRILAITGSVIFLGLVPTVFAVLLFIFRRKVHDPSTMSVMEILCASYRSGVFWYEMVATMRRIGLAAVVALVPGSSAFKMISICLVLVVALYLQIVFRPFVTKFENVMEELSMVTVLLTYAGQFGVNMRFKQMDTVNTVTVVLNFLMIAALIYTYISRTFFSSYRFLPWSSKPKTDDMDFDAASSLSSISTMNRSAPNSLHRRM